MKQQQVIEEIEVELSRNSACEAGLMVSSRVFAVERGPSNGPEMLALVYANEQRADRFWYGHVTCHPVKEAFVSLLAWSTKFVNAPSVPQLFERYRHWMSVDPHYEPCADQAEGDAYAESLTFEEGIAALAEMIRRFEPDRRCGYEGSDYESSRSETRIFGVYGIEGEREGVGFLAGSPNADSVVAVGRRRPRRCHRRSRT